MAACFGPMTESVARVPHLLLICVVLLLSAILFSWQFISYTNWTSASGFESKHLPCSINKIVSDCGANLMHSWTDDELFERSIVVSTLFYRNLTAGKINGTSFDKILAHHNGSGPNPKESALVHIKGNCLEATLSGGGKPKLAFLFLTTDSKLPFAPLWNLFFKGNENLYRIYVHSYPLLRLNLQNCKIGVFSGRFIPSGRTEHGTSSLIQAARRLLANALLDDPLNEYFALISEHCIPLHSFKYIYDTITASSQSFLEVGTDWRGLRGRYDARGIDAMLPEVPFPEFRMGSQFFVLTKKHALMFVQDQKYWNKFKLPCLKGSCFPEEHYFPTMLHIEDPKGSTGYSLTYVNWDQQNGVHPKSYKKEEINQELIVSLRSIKDGRFLFARKFDDDCLPELLNLSSIILAEKRVRW